MWCLRQPGTPPNNPQKRLGSLPPTALLLRLKKVSHALKPDGACENFGSNFSLGWGWVEGAPSLPRPSNLQGPSSMGEDPIEPEAGFASSIAPCLSLPLTD